MLGDIWFKNALVEQKKKKIKMKIFYFLRNHRLKHKTFNFRNDGIPVQSFNDF